MNKKKHFLVAYTATFKNNASSFSVGNVTISSNFCFINQKETIESIIKDNPTFSKVIITNIVKMTDEEYEHWLS